MTLDALRPQAERALTPFVVAAQRLGIGPNGVSAIAFLLAVAAAGLLVLAGQERSWYFFAALLVFASGWLDLVDGALAREQGIDSDRGDVLDHVLDRYADVVLLGGLAVGVGAPWLGFAAVTGVLLTSYLGTQAQAVDVGRVYGGAIGRADRLALITVTCVVAGATARTAVGLGPIEWLLAFLALAGHLTAVQRAVAVWRALD